ncbi:peptidase S8/S53 domain-containing protein [Scenedesmus sp. NREL 46B-D3]|nr:peptidase S8/S53 domain-containing protein [Scenedesmus sp. NREL 46B-D3]
MTPCYIIIPNKFIVALKPGYATPPHQQQRCPIGPAGSASGGVAVAASAPGAAPAALPPVVLRASPAAMQRVRASPRVRLVIQDRFVVPQQAVTAQQCVTAAAARAGVAASALKPNLAAAFTAQGCKLASAKDWARDGRTNQPLLTAAGRPCRLLPGPNSAANRQRFGSCGVAPALAQGLPVRVVPLAADEQIPVGVGFIGAVTKAGVSNMQAGKPLVPPDINYAGGKAFVVPSLAVQGDVADPSVDMYGHGTHVAGIIGGRNGAGGVVGVAPGVGIYSLKVLDAQGVGSLSDALDAVAWAAGPGGRAARIRAINLSLAAYADPAAPDYAATREYVCGVFQAASAAGLVVVAAAGNYASDMRGYLPAACPSVIAVTSMDTASSTPSSFSNFLQEPASAADKACIIAAPGSAILSTMSYHREPSGYLAAPHVAGVAAACIASGACSAADGTASTAVLQAAAMQRLAAQPSYGFAGDARRTSNGKYYGYLTWDKW